MGIPSSPKQASPPAGDLERGDERTPLLARYMSNEDTCVAETQGVAAAAKDSSFTDALKDETVVEAWWTEARVMASSSSNMAVTFFLQYSINFMSVFAAGRLGKVELGAVACKWCMHLACSLPPSPTQTITNADCFCKWPT